MTINKYCIKCNEEVDIEVDSNLVEKYPYYCNDCDENLFEFEVLDGDTN